MPASSPGRNQQEPVINNFGLALLRQDLSREQFTSSGLQPDFFFLSLGSKAKAHILVNQEEPGQSISNHTAGHRMLHHSISPA
jgi:hypothetical protein